MTTVNDIIRRALRRAKIVAIDEDPEADDAAYAVGVFNQMLHGWKAKGVDVSHTTQTLTGTFALDAMYEEGTIFLLSSQLAVDYGLPVPTLNGLDIDDWWRTIKARYITIADSTIDAGLLKLPSQYLNSSKYRF